MNLAALYHIGSTGEVPTGLSRLTPWDSTHLAPPSVGGVYRLGRNGFLQHGSPDGEHRRVMAKRLEQPSLVLWCDLHAGDLPGDVARTVHGIPH